MNGRPAVFLDRDGTLIEERHYPVDEADLVPIKGAGYALARLQAAGLLCIVLSNQSAVARGMLDEERLGELHEALSARLRCDGGTWDALYYCPHHPLGRAIGYGFPCGCRKPARGLLDLAVARHGVDVSRSFFVGDAPRDLFVDAGPCAGRVLVLSGHPLDDVGAADVVLPSVAEAADWILERCGVEPGVLVDGSSDDGVRAVPTPDDLRPGRGAADDR
ncbi:MAG: HAD-IIIA family hydrolase [Planctomycetes bacterium]|nr:HAD-IIIA family hydrolase [Planctomycetota bacterium]